MLNGLERLQRAAGKVKDQQTKQEARRQKALTMMLKGANWYSAADRRLKTLAKRLDRLTESIRSATIQARRAAKTNAAPSATAQ